MKSKDLQNVVYNKFKNGEYPTKLFNDLSGVVSLATIKLWCSIIKNTGKINIGKRRKCTIRSKSTILKVKNQLKRKKNISERKIARRLKI